MRGLIESMDECWDVMGEEWAGRRKGRVIWRKGEGTKEEVREIV